MVRRQTRGARLLDASVVKSVCAALRGGPTCVRLIGPLYGAPRRHSAPTGFCRTRRPHVVRAGTVADLKDRFDEINQLISERQGWVTSVRGDPEVRFECLPGAMLPDELRE